MIGSGRVRAAGEGRGPRRGVVLLAAAMSIGGPLPGCTGGVDRDPPPPEPVRLAPSVWRVTASADRPLWFDLERAGDEVEWAIVRTTPARASDADERVRRGTVQYLLPDGRRARLVFQPSSSARGDGSPPPPSHAEAPSRSGTLEIEYVLVLEVGRFGDADRAAAFTRALSESLADDPPRLRDRDFDPPPRER